MKLSIIIPAYNEEKTIAETIQKVIDLKINNVKKEIIVVNDGSSDKTSQEIKLVVGSRKDIVTLSHNKNMGKGTAIKTGVLSATGDYIVIQDADNEYNPKDIIRMVDLLQGKNANVVYGTRLNRLPNFRKDEKKFLFLAHYIGNRFLSLATSILYGQWLTDMETCYKLFPRKAALEMNLVSKGFDFEPEITAKLLKMGYKILEIPISTKPRGYQEGKKLNALTEGPRALVTLLKYRFIE